jgi:hypothetical protein
MPENFTDDFFEDCEVFFFMWLMFCLFDGDLAIFSSLSVGYVKYLVVIQFNKFE